MSSLVRAFSVAVAYLASITVSSISVVAQGPQNCTPKPSVNVSARSPDYPGHAQANAHFDSELVVFVPETSGPDSGYWFNAHAMVDQVATMTSPLVATIGDVKMAWLKAHSSAYIWAQDGESQSTGLRHATAEGSIFWSTDCAVGENHVASPPGWNQWRVVDSYSCKIHVAATAAASRAGWAKVSFRTRGAERSFVQQIRDNGQTVLTTGYRLDLTGGISAELSGTATSSVTSNDQGGASAIEAQGRRIFSASATGTAGITQLLQTTAASAVDEPPLSFTHNEISSVVAYCHGITEVVKPSLTAELSFTVQSLDPGHWFSEGPVASATASAKGTHDVHITLWEQSFCGLARTPMSLKEIRQDKVPGDGVVTGGATGGSGGGGGAGPDWRPVPGIGSSKHTVGEGDIDEERSTVDALGMGGTGQVGIGGNLYVYAKIRAHSVGVPICFQAANPSSLDLNPVGFYRAMNEQWGDPNVEHSFALASGLVLPKGAWLIRLPCVPLLPGIHDLHFSFGSDIDPDNRGTGHIEAHQSPVLPENWFWGVSVNSDPNSRVLSLNSGIPYGSIWFRPVVLGAEPLLTLDVTWTSGFSWVFPPQLLAVASNSGMKYHVKYIAPPGAQFTIRLTEVSSGAALDLSVVEERP